MEPPTGGKPLVIPPEIAIVSGGYHQRTLGSTPREYHFVTTYGLPSPEGAGIAYGASIGYFRIIGASRFDLCVESQVFGIATASLLNTPT